jgi:hypothetical protein
MIVRAIDENGDWTFGKGRNNYRSGNPAVAQCLQTRLYMFLGDCFFALDEGIDWLNRLGSRNELALKLDIAARILNTKEVTGLLQLQTNLNRGTRGLTTIYEVQTVYSRVADQFRFDLNPIG